MDKECNAFKQIFLEQSRFVNDIIHVSLIIYSKNNTKYFKIFFVHRMYLI